MISEIPMTAHEAKKLSEEQSNKDRYPVGCLECGYTWWLDYVYDEHKHAEMCLCCGSMDIVPKVASVVLATA